MPSAKILIFGFFYASLSTTIGGMTVALTRLIIDQTDPLSLAALRYGLGGLVLAGILYFTRKPPKIQKNYFLVWWFQRHIDQDYMIRGCCIS